MARTVQDILFRYLANTTNLQKGNKRAERSMRTVADTATGLAKTFALAYGGREVLQLGADSVRAASDYTEALNAVEVATGRASKQIIRLGDVSAESFGIGKTEMLEAATAFAGFADEIDRSDVGGTFEEFLLRATDFASVFNIEVSDALDDFQSGLAGQSRPLRKFGIDMSAASVSAFAAANGIGEVGKELTDSEKVQARYGLLLQETAKVQGDFAKTSKEVANRQRILQSQWEDAKIEIGRKLLPVWEDMLTLIAASEPLLETAIDQFGDLADVVGFLSSTVAASFSSLDDLNTIFEDTRGVAKRASDAVKILNPALAATDFVVTKLGGASIFLNDQIERVSPLFATATTKAGQYERSVGDATKASNEFASEQAALQAELRSTDRLVDIFTGDLFAAARAMRGLVRSSHGEDLGGLFAGGGGSGQTTMHTGGIVPGPKGTDVPIVAQAGERITPLSGSGSGGGVTINFNGVVGDPVAVAEEIQDLLELYGRTNNAF